MIANMRVIFVTNNKRIMIYPDKVTPTWGYFSKLWMYVIDSCLGVSLAPTRQELDK